LRKFYAPGVVFLVVLSGKAVMAQSTIFNVPTTDVVAKGKVYFEFDYLPQLPKTENTDRLHTIVPRGVAGLGRNVEAGANVAFFHSGDTTNSFLQPNIKWKFANSDVKGVAAAVGGILYTPIDTPPGVDTYGLVYGNFSKKVKNEYGPRFTAGPYGVVSGGADWVGPKAGVILGYEQPIHSKASIVADWFSGKNSFGYLTPGVSFTLPANGQLNIGYSIGNDSYDGNNNRFLFLYYGVTF